MITTMSLIMMMTTDVDGATSMRTKLASSTKITDLRSVQSQSSCGIAIASDYKLYLDGVVSPIGEVSLELGSTYGEGGAIKHYIWIYNLEVFEDYRGMGYGKELMFHILDIAEKRGDIVYLALRVEINNSIARRLYESFGFGPNYNQFIGEHTYAITYRKELKVINKNNAAQMRMDMANLGEICYKNLS